ncbi:MAG: HzsA-related protein [Planctomycetota bacterium]|jgi:mono/diheme cytochrome c family protein
MRIHLFVSACCVATMLAGAGAEARSPAAEALLARGVKEIVFSERRFCGDGHWYANFGYFFDGPDRPVYSDGGRLVKLDVESGKTTAIFEDPKGTIRDPCVHYDAKKVLFSYRKGGTMQFHLYEIGVDGTGLKQLTDGIFDDLEPTYLPDGGIAFVSGRAKRWVNCWLVQVATLYRCDGDGKNIRQLSVNIEQDNAPWVLPDGRIIFTRWEYVDRSQVQFHHLWTCNPDGTNQAAYFGNMHPGGVFIDAKPIPGTDRVVFINSPGHGKKEHAGHLSTVTDRHGPDAKSSEKRIGNIFCRDPYAVSEDCFIIADGRKIQVVDGSGRRSDLHTGRLEVSEPRPIIKRKRERVVPPRVDWSKETGTLILGNAYVGRKMKGVKKGEIKKLMILETLPKPLNYGSGLHDFWPITHGGTFTLERILGTVPVEADGSAHFEVPANRPLFFIALNEKNESVKRMHSFLSVMPGEVLSCVGCHETRVKTPERREHGVVMAMKRRASRIEPVAGVPYMIDFPKHIQPILDKHCIKCHNPDKPDGKIILAGDYGPVYSHSYMALTGLGLVSDGRNRQGNTAPRSVGDSASRLMKMLDGSHYKAKLSGVEVEMIRNWIHVGASYPGTYAALGTGMIRGNTLPRTHGPARKKAEAAFKQRCASCHRNRFPAMANYSKAGGKNKGNYFWDTHMTFNLTRPEKSILLLAPLSKSAGGWGTCKPRDGKSQSSDGRIEGESLKPLSFQRKAKPQNMTGFGRTWSGHAHLLWNRPSRAGEELLLEFNVLRSGTYEVKVNLTKAGDYGVFSFRIDDGPASQDIDTYDPRVCGPFPYKLKTMALKAGAHRLKVLVKGKNQRSRAMLFGIDSIDLVPDAKTRRDMAKKKAEPEPFRGVFRDTSDPGYRAMLALVEMGKSAIDKNKRWDMPGFKPHPYHVREMKRFGILPESFDVDRDSVDVFDLDRRYWESLWHYPRGGGPKLHENEKMKRMLVSPPRGVKWAKDLRSQR